MNAKLQGRRRPDAAPEDLPPDIMPGDYWKVTATNRRVPEYWYIAVPLGRVGTAYALGNPINLINLINHTVRGEHEDGSISVSPGDGSSNSILVTRGDQSWHGYVDHGVLWEC